MVPCRLVRINTSICYDYIIIFGIYVFELCSNESGDIEIILKYKNTHYV